MNRGLSRRTWRESAFLVLTKRKAGSREGIGGQVFAVERCGWLFRTVNSKECRVASRIFSRVLSNENSFLARRT